MASSASSSSSPLDRGSDSDSDILHELCNNVNLGLAKASTVGSESYKSSLSAITTDSSDIAVHQIHADLTSNLTPETQAVTQSSKKSSLKSIIRTHCEPTLQRKDSLEKVIKVIDSRPSARPEASTSQSNESLPKDKLTLDSETLLILNLLSMSSDMREQHLIEVAKQRKLLLTNSKTKTFNVNPHLFGVDNVPEVVDFVHQFHGKPVPPDAEPQTSVLKTKQKVKKKEKEKKSLRTLIFESQNFNIPSSELMAQSNPQERSKKPSSVSSSVSNATVHSVVQKSSKNARTETQPRANLMNFMDVNLSKQRNIHRQSVGLDVTKQQQQRLRKKLRAMSLECTLQANAEKAPRKRGRRGSNKGTAEEQTAKSTTANLNESEARNAIRNKCSQINVRIQEKLGHCAPSVQPGPSTSMIRSDDLVIESIDRSDKSDEDDCDSSSVMSDSSNFPNDEETTSYFAKSDEMDSSCNEKRVGPTALLDGNMLNEDITARGDTLKVHIQATDPPPTQSISEKCARKPNIPLSLNNECLLIMSLLTAKDESTRNDLLRRAAVSKNIFLKDQDNEILNNRLVRMKSVFASPKITRFIEENTPKKRKGKETYESEVNQLIRRYVAEADMYEYNLKEMVLDNGRYDFTNQVNRTAIDLYVESLINANFGKIVEGDIRVNEYDNTEAYMTNEDDDRDIYFSSTLIRQCAFHGTRVKAFAFTAEDRTPLHPKENGKRIVRGFVIEILGDQSKKQIIGKFDLNHTKSSSIDLVPDDRRFPRIRIDKSSDEMLSSKTIVPQNNTLYLVKVNYWKNKRAYGSVLEEIGKADELEAGNRAVLLKNSLKPMIFSESILSALPKEPFVIPKAEYDARENLTKDCIFTIDPLTARDLDDAVSCKKLGNGNFEVGVHISDVSYFIHENSELDNIVKDQATTIYLVNTVYHMLPKQLCMLCSLLPGQDKLTFSVFWEITPTAEIVSTRFAKTIINSCSQFAYEHAQLMIDQPEREFEQDELPKIYRFTSRELRETVHMLNAIATILRKNRFDNGCISINQNKIIFRLDEDGEPTDFRPDDRSDSNFLIEEFMLLANQSVAKFIFDKFPAIAVLRNHAPPKANMMTELVAKMSALNYKMNISSSKDIANSIAEIIRLSGNNEAVSAVLNSMVAKPMVRAEYICSGQVKNVKALSHFALSIPIYTHFTSPIRRYPDILVHRLLAAALNLGPIPTRSPADLRSIARTCNDQKYNAKLAGEDSTNLYFLHYLRRFGPIKMRAAVKEISKGIDLHLMLIDSGHNIRVNIKRNEPELMFTVDDHGVPRIQFVGCENSPTIRANIFDVVLVEAYAKNNKIKAQLVSTI